MKGMSFVKIVYSSNWSKVKKAIMDYDWKNTKFSFFKSVAA